MADNPTIESETRPCPPDPLPPVVASRPIRHSGYRIGTFAATLFLVMIAVLVGYRIILDYKQTDDATIVSEKHAYEVIGVSTRILSVTGDTETGQRGFPLTGKPANLEPYGTGMDALRRDLSLIRDLTTDDPHQQDNLLALHNLLQRKQAELAHAIDLAQHGDKNGALAIVNTDEGMRLMEAIRHTVTGIVGDEQQRLLAWHAQRQHARDASGQLLIVLLAATGGGAMVGGIAVGWLFSSAAAGRREAAQDEQRRLMSMTDLAAIMVRDFDGPIRFWSEGCHALFGWTAGQAVGQSSHTLLGTVFPVPLADIQAALLRDGSWRGESRQRRQDGSEVIVSAHKALRREADGSLTIMENVTDVTKQRRAEAALRDNEARLRLVQAVGGIAYTDQALPGSTGMVSHEYVTLYGLPKSATQITEAEWRAFLHPDDRDRLDAEITVLMAGGGPLATEFRIRRADGSVRWIAMRVEAFFGEDGQPLRLISAQRDITELVAAREALASHATDLERQVAERTAALAAAEARYRAIFDSQLEFIGLLDPDGTMLEANRTALEAAGLTRKDIIGRSFWETGWWPAAERDRLRQDIAEAAAGMVIRREVKNIGADRREIWLDFSLKPIRDAVTDKTVWIVAEGRNITEQRSLSNQLVQANKVQALGQLASGIAHDFNNILQAVEGAATLIERRPEHHDKVRRLARMVVDATARGGSITQRLLSFARRGEFHPEPLPTADLLANIREVLAHTLGASIVVQSTMPPGVPPVLADRGQLETVLVNLGTNARDAMPEGGTLTLSADVEFVAADDHRPAGLASGAYVRLSVTDTGTGMDAATLARAAELFFTTKPLGQGTGLGLAMVKAFAEQSGGAMAIASTPSEGTTVTLRLRQATEGTTPPDGEADSHGDTIDASAHILLVDDDDMIRELLAAQLEDLGFRMLVASRGAEAIALLEAGETVDVLVSDLSMPGMNGVATIEKARTLRPRLPCFLLTGYVGERAALAAGDAFTLVRKPVSAQALAARIEAGLAATRR
ncbi:PAS domain S-box protein [Rhodopila globiformis]|uniref:histidine kinase n=1 Tax=Rhodopila globiformis TaxID=1071 RepID=A0A2S6N8Y3_RHOGL|nr:PAS domain S-box protein [Rhodopila globiformis]PPQ31069.1 hypothetical protein CCS01_18105 [Rhodopila globiformis]